MAVGRARICSGRHCTNRKFPVSLYLGIDLGTSGCRVVAIDTEGRVCARATSPLPSPERSGAKIEQDPDLWWDAAVTALRTVLQSVPAAAIRALAVDGTSATILFTNGDGRPLGPALMYNDARSRQEAERVAVVAPVASGAHGATSSLSKLLHLQEQMRDACHALHQADWLAGQFCRRFGVSDENNALVNYTGQLIFFQ